MGEEVEVHERSGRSLFWPIVLIGVGVLWLLASLDVLQPEQIWALVRWWPLGLILIGVHILVSPRWSGAGTALGVIGVALAIVLALTAPTGGQVASRPAWWRAVWGKGVTLQEAHLSEPVGDATEAHVTLALSRWRTQLSVLPEAATGAEELLFEADVPHTGGLSYSVTGDSGEKAIRLASTSPVGLGLGWGPDTTQWAVGLNPRVPTALDIDVGSGGLYANLAGMVLTEFTFDGGSGRAEVVLPATEAELPIRADVASGSFELRAPAGSSLRGIIEGGSGSQVCRIGENSAATLDIDGASGHTTLSLEDGCDGNFRFDGGSGSADFRLPSDAALRVEVIGEGTGTLRLPSAMERIAGREGEDEGVWQSDDWASAAHRVTLTIDLATGSVSVTR